MEHQPFLNSILDNRRKFGKEIIAVLNIDLEENLFTDFQTKMKIVKLATFNRSVLGEENCVLYHIQFMELE
jgi:hypothetical protein